MKKKIVLFVFIIVLIYSIGGIIYFYFIKKDDPIIKDIASIKGYNYTLQSNATELMKTEFETLKKNLESNAINEEAYASSIAKLFIIDLYTISNKMNKYDVGGSNYVMPVGLESYKTNVKDTLYKYVEDNTNGTRIQDLPEVISITIASTEEMEIDVSDTKYQGYKINLDWEYLKDDGYDITGEVKLIKDGKYYYITEKN